MQFLKKYPSYKFVLAFLDYTALSAAFFIGLKVRFWPKIDLINNPDYFIHPSYWPLLIYALLALFVFQYYNLYKKHIIITFVQQQVLIFKTLLIVFIGYMIIAFSIRYPQYLIDSRLVILYSWISAIVLVSIFRLLVFRYIYLTFAKKHLIHRRVLIVGAGKSGRMVAANMITDKRYGMDLVGFVDDNIPAGTKIFQSYIVLGNTGEIMELVEIYDIQDIIISVSKTSYDELIEIIEKCNATGRLVHVYSELYDIVANKVEVEKFSEIPLVRMGQFYNEGINHIVKRVIDIVGSMLGILLFSPFFIGIAIAIKLDSPGPILFKQKRLGKNGKLFNFLKFRSMYVNNDDSIHREYLRNLIKNGKKAKDGGQEGVFKLVNDPRITRVGAFIRKWSLDELPQFFNVLKGDMSLVGPRPALPYEFDEYNEWHKNRVKVLPGITGLWQISGRNNIPFDDMVVLDLYYMENMSPWFDLQILLKTFPVVFLGKTGY